MTKPYPVEVEQPLLDLFCIARSIVQPTEGATIVRNEHFAVAENLGRLAAIVADVAALTHHRINEEIPACTKNLPWLAQTMPDEASIGILAMVSEIRPPNRQARQERSEYSASLCLARSIPSSSE